MAEEKKSAKKQDSQNTASKSSAGMDPKVAALLCWLLTPFASLIFMLMDDMKDDDFIQFNAEESLYFGLAQIVLSFALPIPGIGCVIGLVNVGLFVARIVIAVKAYNGERVEVPVIIDLVKNK
jgi:uncharacterized membrane protein